MKDRGTIFLSSRKRKEKNAYRTSSPVASLFLRVFSSTIFNSNAAYSKILFPHQKQHTFLPFNPIESQQMNLQRNQPESPGIYNRLMNFVRKRVAAAALKCRILGVLLHQSLSDCHQNFKRSIITHLSPAVQPRKSATWGASVHRKSPQMPNSGDLQNSYSTDLEKDGKWVPPSQDNDGVEEKMDSYDNPDGENKPEDSDVVPKPAIEYTQERGPPKKIVSIKDTPELVIYPTKDKKVKKKKSTDKLSSMDWEKDEEPKPRKSILKVGSSLSDDKQQYDQGKIDE